MLLPYAPRALAAPADIPFDVDDSRIIVPVEFGPGRMLPFAFDSGLSDSNLVSPDAARKAGLKPSPASKPAAPGAGAGSVRGVSSASVRVGSAVMPSSPFLILDLPEPAIARAGKPPLAGYLGQPLLSGAVLCVDYEHHVMHRFAPTDFKKGTRTSIPLTTIHGQPTILVTVDGRRARLVVDTGNNAAITIFSEFAIRNDFEHRYPDLAVSREDSADGVNASALIGEAKVVELTPDIGFARAPMAVVHQHFDPAWGIDGLLGYVILSKLNPCIDEAGQQLLFEHG